MYWQSLLRTDNTLRMWVNVSRSWASLESIFLASADIRPQLPEDTKRFEGIDSEFKELMKEVVTESNCINACSVDGRLEVFKGIRDRLELCQKSFNEYLDIKKNIFPDFTLLADVLFVLLEDGTTSEKLQIL